MTHDCEPSLQSLYQFGVFYFIFFNSCQCFIVAPYFLCSGRNKNCIVTAVTGGKLSQYTSLTGFFNAAQTTKLNDLRQVSPDRVKCLQFIISVQPRSFKTKFNHRNHRKFVSIKQSCLKSSINSAQDQSDLSKIMSWALSSNRSDIFGEKLVKFVLKHAADEVTIMSAIRNYHWWSFSIAAFLATLVDVTSPAVQCRAFYACKCKGRQCVFRLAGANNSPFSLSHW